MVPISMKCKRPAMETQNHLKLSCSLSWPCITRRVWKLLSCCYCLLLILLGCIKVGCKEVNQPGHKPQQPTRKHQRSTSMRQRETKSNDQKFNQRTDEPPKTKTNQPTTQNQTKIEPPLVGWGSAGSAGALVARCPFGICWRTSSNKWRINGLVMVNVFSIDQYCQWCAMISNNG